MARRTTAVYRPVKQKKPKASFQPVGPHGGVIRPFGTTGSAQRNPGVPLPAGYGQPGGAGASQPPQFNPYMDAGYQSAIAGAQRDLSLQTGDLNYNEQRIKQDYGFDDPSNPYSRAKLLERAYAQSQAQTTNQNASQGQLYSGANQRQLDYGTTQYNQNVDQARRSYADQLHSIAVGRTGAQNQYLGAQGQAYGDALSRSLQTPPEDPAPAQASQRSQLQTKGYQNIVGLGGGKWRVTAKNGKTYIWQNGTRRPA